MNTESWTAVSASARIAQQTHDTNQASIPPQNRIVTGKWTDSALLQGEQFDTVLLDYLIGAIDGFTPYWQDLALKRIKPHVRGRLYIVGLQPYVPLAI